MNFVSYNMGRHGCSNILVGHPLSFIKTSMFRQLSQFFPVIKTQWPIYWYEFETLEFLYVLTFFIFS